MTLRTVAPAFLLPLLACGGGDAASSPTPLTFPLPAGVYEARVALEFDEGEPGWTVPLPASVEMRLVVAEPEDDRQELTFYGLVPARAEDDPRMPWADGVRFERVQDGSYRLDDLFLIGSSSPEPCGRVIQLHAKAPVLSARDLDGDGIRETIEGNLSGRAVESNPHDREADPARPFRGSLLATVDRTPPEIVPSNDLALPWGSFPVRWSEPVLLEHLDFTVETEAGALPVTSNLHPALWPHPLVGYRFFQDGPAIGQWSLPPGAPVRLGRLRVHDLAGNVLDVDPVDPGLQVVAPEGRPVASFEDGALAGWVTEGQVRAVRSTQEVRAVDGEWLVTASDHRGFRLVARLDVPDTGSPALELAAGIAGSPWDDVLWLVVEADGVVRISDPRRLGTWPAEPLRFDLSPVRGRTVTLALGKSGEPWCTDGHDEVVVDSFRVIP